MGMGLQKYHKCQKKMGQLWVKRRANYDLKWIWILNNITKVRKDWPTMGQNKRAKKWLNGPRF
jgi:hypothetical protein